MTYKWPYATDKFTAYEGEKHTTRLSMALWIVDDYTGKQPLNQVKVRMKEGDISDEECDIKTKEGFFNAVKNPSGYHIFTDLPPRTYSCCIESDPYFPEKKTISGTKDVILEFDGTGPGQDKTDTKLKDASILKIGDSVEFRNITGDVEQRKITNILEKTISWAEKLKFDFSSKGSTIRVIRLLEFAISGPAKDMNSIELKDISRLEKGDIVEFQNLRGDIEQRKITDIIGNQTIVWAEKLKFDFTAKGSFLRVLSYIIDEIYLKPRPSYPFPDNTTLVRGLVFGPDNLPAQKAKIKIQDLKETRTNENGDFVLYFDESDFNGLLLFSWDKIPGSDNEKLIGFLKQNYDIDWVETAEIEKTADDNNVSITKDENSLSLKLNDEKTKVTLEIDDGRTDEFVVRKEKDKLNIFSNIIIEVEINSTSKIVKTNLEKGKTMILEKINF